MRRYEVAFSIVFIGVRDIIISFGFSQWYWFMLYGRLGEYGW